MSGEERQKMGERGRKLYLKNYTVQSIAGQLTALYRTALTV
jgi:glycosyltransferase involved in cell wall biosynthesis